MKRLIMLLLAGVLLSATIVMAQDRAMGTYPAGTPSPAQEQETSEQPATPSETTRIYQYANEKGQWVLTAENPSEFSKSLPKGWTSFDTIWTYSSVSRETATNIISTAQKLGIPPIDVYENKARFALTGTKTAILEGKDLYEYENNVLSVITIDDKTFRSDIDFFGVNAYQWWWSSFGRPVELHLVQDPSTKEFIFVYDDGNKVPTEEVEKFKSEYPTAFEQAQKIIDASIKSQKLQKEAQKRQVTLDIVGFFSQLTWYFQQYKGMAGWSSLFFDEEFLEDWKQGVNTFFCNIILGGTDCWVSKICGSYADITPSKNGVLFTSSAGGGIEPMAHIEGQRSLPIETPEGQSWIYTITFGIRNSGDETMSYNVRFSGPQKSAVWWDSPQPLPKGLTASATGGSALIKHSNNDYREVCLEFSPAIRPFGSTDIIGGGVSKICNNIVQPSGTATAPYSTANTTTQQVCITTIIGKKQCGPPAQASQPATPPSTPGRNV
jgi:hypothetical protein